jgi:hypothetical protein
MEKEFSKLCTPAKIYFVLAIIASIFALFSGMGIVSVVVKLIFAFIWTFILSWLCQKGYKSLSWFLVLLPYVLILLVLIGLTKSSYSSYTSMLYPGYTPSYGSSMMAPMNGSGMMMPSMMMPSMMMKEGMSGMMKKKQ